MYRFARYPRVFTVGDLLQFFVGHFVGLYVAVKVRAATFEDVFFQVFAS